MNALLIRMLNFRNEIVLVKTAACLLSRCKRDTGLPEIETGALAYLDIVETLVTLSGQGEESRETGLQAQDLVEPVTLTALPPTTGSGGLLQSCC